MALLRLSAFVVFLVVFEVGEVALGVVVVVGAGLAVV
jgi:hypothetical protein